MQHPTLTMSPEGLDDADYLGILTHPVWSPMVLEARQQCDTREDRISAAWTVLHTAALAAVGDSAQAVMLRHRLAYAELLAMAPSTFDHWVNTAADQVATELVTAS